MTARPDEVLYTVSQVGEVSADQVRVDRVHDSAEVDVWIGPARLRLAGRKSVEVAALALLAAARNPGRIVDPFADLAELAAQLGMTSGELRTILAMSWEIEEQRREIGSLRHKVTERDAQIAGLQTDLVVLSEHHARACDEVDALLTAQTDRILAKRAEGGPVAPGGPVVGTDGIDCVLPSPGMPDLLVTADPYYTRPGFALRVQTGPETDPQAIGAAVHAALAALPPSVGDLR